jgi:hypothetical protein
MVLAGREGRWKYEGVLEELEGPKPPRPRMEGVDWAAFGGVLL